MYPKLLNQRQVNRLGEVVVVDGGNKTRSQHVTGVEWETEDSQDVNHSSVII